MDENIKTARQTGILLILILVFSFNLHEDLKLNFEKLKALHGFLPIKLSLPQKALP